MKRQQQGVTLVEILLVLLVGVSMIIFSLRQYQAWQRDANVRLLVSNVNQTLAAMSNFYYANCSPVRPDPSSTLSTATLPAGRLAPTVTSPVLINMAADLVTPGYMPTVKNNPLVLNTSSYILQFNKYTSTRNIATNSGVTQIGTIVRWMPQVSVLIRDVANAATYQKLLNADCLSSLNGTTVFPCSANQTGNYIVWERPPSYFTQKLGSESNSWGSLPTVQQFNQMYTTLPITNLTGNSHTPEFQYFYCGG